MVTCTMALSAAQGHWPVILYLYGPEIEVAGWMVPVCSTPLGSYQEPPLWAPGPSSGERSNAASLSHTVMLASLPANGAGLTSTCRLAVELGQFGLFTV